MAANKRERARVSVEPSAVIAAGVPANPEAQVKQLPTCVANVPKAFTLTDDDHKPHHYTVGTHPKMPIAHAEHWFARAHGVEIVKGA